MPIAGSAYAYATLGELIARVIGWDLAIGVALTSCTAPGEAGSRPEPIARPEPNDG